MLRSPKARLACITLLLVLTCSIVLPRPVQAASALCSDRTVGKAHAEAVRYMREGSHLQAWSAAHAVGRCYGELSLFHSERLHYQEMYLAGVFCLFAYGAGKEDAKLTNSDAGSLLLINDLVYSATMLKSIADDDRAPKDLRSHSRLIVSRLVEAVRKAGAPLAFAPSS